MTKRLKKILLTISLLVSAVLTGCGGGDSFTISGIILGGGTQNLHICYMVEGTMVDALTVAVDGKFRYEGSVAQPTMVEIFSSGRKLIGRVYVKNGDAVEGEWDIDKYYAAKVDGNSESSEWAKFLRENADALDSKSPSAGNEVITQYIVSHPDNVVSTLLLITSYDATVNEAGADSLYSLIEPTARPDALVASYRQMLSAISSDKMTRRLIPLRLYAGEDSVISYNHVRQSYSLLCFTGRDGRDSVVKVLQRLTDDYPQKRLRIVDISFAPDTAAWRNATRRDSASWDEAWTVGAATNKAIEYLSIPRTPYFIVADSTGTQLFRGSSISQAQALIDSKLKQ